MEPRKTRFWLSGHGATTGCVTLELSAAQGGWRRQTTSEGVKWISFWARIDSRDCGRMGNAGRSAESLTLPVFGLYSGYCNQVQVNFQFTDGSSSQSIVPVRTAPYDDPLGIYDRPIINVKRAMGSSLGFSFFVLKTGIRPPVVIDTDGEIRWVGASLEHSEWQPVSNWSARCVHHAGWSTPIVQRWNTERQRANWRTGRRKQAVQCSVCVQHRRRIENCDGDVGLRLREEHRVAGLL